MRQKLKDFFKKHDWLDRRALATVLATKFLILIYGIQSFQIINNESIKEAYWYLGLWKRWDAESFLNITQNGYAGTGENRFLIVFFPLYPALIALFNFVVRDYLLSAFLVSALASIAAGLLLRKLVKLDYGETTAQFSVFFLFVFPTSFFLHVPYTESLFLALCVGCFLAARTKRWILAGILGALCCLTRINGLILLPALAFEVWDEYRETKRFNPKWLSLLIVAAGFAAYLGLNYFVAGDPTMFLTYQREHWQKFLTFPWRGIWGAIDRVRFLAPNDGQMTGTQELVFAGIGLFATVAGWRSMRPSYRVWMLLNWLLFVSTSFLMSIPRYTLVMFPLFVLMARAARRNWSAGVFFAVWSILYLALFTSLYVRGWWAF